MERIELLSTTEVARIFEVQPATLTNWRYRGMGPRFIKVGRKAMYRRADIEAYLDARAAGSTAENGQLPAGGPVR